MNTRIITLAVALAMLSGVSLSAQQRVNQGSLSVGDTRESVLEPGQEHTWTLSVPSAQQVTISMTRLDTSIDPYIEVEDAGGSEIASNDDGGDGLNSQLTTQLGPGDYTIVAREFGRNDRGRYRIVVSGGGMAQAPQPAPQPAPPQGGAIPIALGQTIDAYLTEGSTQNFALQVPRATRLQIDFSRSQGSEIDPYLVLRDQFGTEIESNDDGGSGFDSRITIMLNPGSYTIAARDLGNNSAGAFRMSVVEVGAVDVSGIPIAVGQTLESYIAEGQEQPFILTVQSGGQIVIDLEDTSNIDPYLTLNDAGGMQIASDDDGGSGFNSRISRYLEPGRYQIIARDLGNNRSGSFRLSVRVAQQVQEIPLTVGQTYQGNLNGDVGQPFLLTITAGTDVRIDFEALDGADFDPFLELSDVGGREIETDDDGGSGFNSRISRFLEPGQYRLLARDLFGDGSGPFRVSVNAGAAVSAIPIGVGQSYDGFMQPGQEMVYELRLDSGRQVTIEFVRTGGSSFDPYLTLSDTGGNEIATNDDNGSSLDSRISTFLEAGSYIIRAQDLWQDTGGSFRISVY